MHDASQKKQTRRLTMKFVLTAILASVILTACVPTHTVTRGGGGGGGGGYTSTAPDLGRLREVETRPGESVRDDATPNDTGQQGTNGGHNSPDADQPGKPGKISG
jgi:hypothetical protein